MSTRPQYKTPAYATVSHDWLVDSTRFAPAAQYLQSLPEHGVLSAQQGHIIMPQESFVLLWVGAGGHAVSNEVATTSRTDEARLYLVPSNTMLHLKALEGEVRYLMLIFRPHPNLCMGMCPSEDSIGVGRRRRSGKSRPRRGAPRITDLPLSDGVQLWLQTLEKYLQYGDVSIHMYDFKLQELFLLLRLDYTRAVIDDFLRYYHCRITGFRSKVVESYTPTMDVSDMYRIAEELGLNELAFKRSFIEEFGMPPRDWITLQRTRYIYHDLVTSTASIGEIGERYGFCSMSYFSLFCKSNLGGTPMQIRKNRGALSVELDEE